MVAWGVTGRFESARGRYVEPGVPTGGGRRVPFGGSPPNLVTSNGGGVHTGMESPWGLAARYVYWRCGRVHAGDAAGASAARGAQPQHNSSRSATFVHVAEWGSKLESGQARGQPGRAHGQAATHEENVGAKGAMGLRAP